MFFPYRYGRLNLEAPPTSVDGTHRRVIGFSDHSAVTVTVDDLEGLEAAINDRIGGRAR